MKLEPIWKSITEAPTNDKERFFVKNMAGFIYTGCYLDYSGDLQTTIWDGTSRTLHKEDYTWTKELSQDLSATLVSETFSATGYVLGIGWDGYSGTLPTKEFTSEISLRSLLSQLNINLSIGDLIGMGDFQSQLGAIMLVSTTTTVAIQGHLFTNISESIEFIGELAEEQKKTLRSLV